MWPHMLKINNNNKMNNPKGKNTRESNKNTYYRGVRVVLKLCTNRTKFKSTIDGKN